MSWERTLPAIGTLLLPIAAVLALFGQGPGAIALIAAFAIVLVVTMGRRRRRPGEVEWATAPANPRPSSEPSRGSVARSLAVVEMRELLLSPWFAAGIGFCVVFGSIAAIGFVNSWWMSFGLMPLLIHPLCGMIIVAEHRNVTRAHRDGADELFGSCPATETERTKAHLLTFPLPVAAATVMVVGTLGFAAIFIDNIYGPVGFRAISDAIIAGLVLPAGAVALGVLLGRRARFVLTPFIALGIILVLNMEMADRGLDGRGWLTTGIATGGVDFIYVSPPSLGRLLWIAGLSLLVAGLALGVRGRRGPSIAVAVGVVVALVGMVAAVQPLSDAKAQQLTEYVIEPYEHETCHSLPNNISVCALEPYSDHGTAVAQFLQPVAAAIPDDAIDQPITMRLLAGSALDQLPSQVQALLTPTPIPQGTVRLPFDHSESAFAEARFMLASEAVGLPISFDQSDSLLVDGQARGVVVLWLTVADLDPAEARRMLTPDQYNEQTPSGQGHVWPGTCYATVQWASQDLTAARALVDADKTMVAEVISEGWDRWTSADTITDDLLIAIGLPTVGPPDPIEPLGATC